MTEMRLGLMP